MQNFEPKMSFQIKTIIYNAEMLVSLAKLIHNHCQLWKESAIQLSEQLVQISYYKFFTEKEKSLRNTQEGQLTIISVSTAKKCSGVSCHTIHLNNQYFQKKRFYLSSPFPTPSLLPYRPPQIHSYPVKLLCNHSKYNIILLKDMESKI